MNLVTAPAGWGFVTGYPLAGLTAEQLPDLPMLRFLDREQRNTAIVEGIRSVPGLAQAVRACDVRRRYNLPHSTSIFILQRAREGGHHG